MSGAFNARPAVSLRIAPNPFTSSTTISYSLPNATSLSIKLYDISGKVVTTLANGRYQAGASSVTLQASGLARGIYILKFESGSYNTTRKLVIE